MKKDFVSIITVNYNGRRYLDVFLKSASELDYPKDKHEVIVVDNGSKDDSIAFVKENYPHVRILKVGKNVGFGRGNNYGMERAKGGLFYFVNNDTYLEKDSLKNIVKCFHKWSKKGKIGAINSKLVLFDYYFPVRIEKALFNDYYIPKNARPQNFHVYTHLYLKNRLHVEEAYIPINHSFNDDINIRIDVRYIGWDSFKVCYGKDIFNEECQNIIEEKFSRVMNIKKRKLTINIGGRLLKKERINLVQNAGNFFFRDGHGRDRGACVISHKQHYEPDLGQYDKDQIIPAFCGAGVLLNKKALDNVGMFDEDFFMYYEDGDLSLRLIERGWKIIYCPDAVIRHVHAGSSKEFSSFFQFNVERSRLLLVAKHWPRLLVFKEITKYIVKDVFGSFFYNLINGETESSLSKLKLRARVCLSLLLPFVISFFKIRRLTQKEIQKFL